MLLERRTKLLFNVLIMAQGYKVVDGSHLLLSNEDKEKLLAEKSQSEQSD